MNSQTLLIPDIAWVEIPEGSFLYGEKKDIKTLELPTFWMAKYPVTNGQYQTFIDAGGYDEPRWWHDLIKPEPEDSHWTQSNRPRTDIDWYEAVAFCRWLSVMLDLGSEAIRLPSEEEWEKAARGENGLDYPWGNDYRSGFANIDETENGNGSWYLQQTTAVGLYSHSESSYGVQDLAGNVWEWCLNKYNHPKVIEPDSSGDWRVLRGGSWLVTSDFARAGLRNGDFPGFRVSSRGFRVLSSVPIR